AREEVPESVLSAYGGETLKFGPEYIIPKPVDERGLYWVAPAVAKAAIETGVHRYELDVEHYREELSRKLSPTRRVMWKITSVARSAPKRVVFPEGEEDKILRAAQIIVDGGIAQPILVGRPRVIRQKSELLGVSLDGVEIVDRTNLPRL